MVKEQILKDMKFATGDVITFNGMEGYIAKNPKLLAWDQDTPVKPGENLEIFHADRVNGYYFIRDIGIMTYNKTKKTYIFHRPFNNRQLVHKSLLEAVCSPLNKDEGTLFDYL